MPVVGSQRPRLPFRRKISRDPRLGRDPRHFVAGAGPGALASLFPDSDLRPPAGLTDGDRLTWAAVADAFRSPVALPGLDGMRALFGDDEIVDLTEPLPRE